MNFNTDFSSLLLAAFSFVKFLKIKTHMNSIHKFHSFLIIKKTKLKAYSYIHSYIYI